MNDSGRQTSARQPASDDPVLDPAVVIAKCRSQYLNFLYPHENTRPGWILGPVPVAGHAIVRMEEGCRGFL